FRLMPLFGFHLCELFLATLFSSCRRLRPSHKLQMIVMRRDALGDLAMRADMNAARSRKRGVVNGDDETRPGMHLRSGHEPVCPQQGILGNAVAAGYDRRRLALSDDNRH